MLSAQMNRTLLTIEFIFSFTVLLIMFGAFCIAGVLSLFAGPVLFGPTLFTLIICFIGFTGLYGAVNFWRHLYTGRPEMIKTRHRVSVMVGIAACLILLVGLLVSVFDWTNPAVWILLAGVILPILCAVHFLYLLRVSKADNNHFNNGLGLRRAH
jgi:hypothetical protein